MPHGIRTRDHRTAQLPNLGAVGASGKPADLLDLLGRPTQPHGPHHLSFDAWQLLTSSQGRFQGVELQSSAEEAMAPPYIYERRG
jgi:hypothetical protein